MVQEPEIQGICCTCNSRWSCLSLNNSLKLGEPILYCEEFDDSEITKQSEQIDERERRKSAHSFNTPINFGIEI
jgi:hypothetical protein